MNDNTLVSKWIVPLGSAARSNIKEVGGKAANLGELLVAGYAVPEGFVLKTEAFEHFQITNQLGYTSSREEVLKAVMPPEIQQELVRASKAFGDSSLAVRSSGVSEDLPSASFAGQYESILNVRGPEALVEAVKRCWASAYGARVKSYATTRISETNNAPVLDASRIAVLAQRLVPAHSAGVAFTANPLTGDPTEVVINAVKGLGERLVSGQVSPDEWIVHGTNACCLRNPESAIEKSQALEVAELAKQIEKHFGIPQDIEWAFDGEKKLYLLQARPITTLSKEAKEEDDTVPVPVPVDVPEGFWQRDEVFHPRPYLPMDRSTSLSLENVVFRRIFSDFGLLLEGQEGKEIGGWYYFRLVPPGGKDRSPPPNRLMPLLIRVVPQIRSRIKTCVEAVRSDKPGKYIELWYNEWLSRASSDAARLRSVELGSLSNSELDEHLTSCMKFLKDGLDVHFNLVIPWVLIVGEFVLTCREQLHWDDQKIIEMVSGLSVRSTEPSRALSDLAKLAKSSNEVSKLVLDSSSMSRNSDILGRLEGLDKKFADTFNEYRREFGCRTLRYTLSDPTLSEKPELILDLVRDQIIRSYDPVSSAAALEKRRRILIEEARALLTGSSLERFERLLKRAERAYPTLEDSQFYTAGVPRALVRYALLEIGERLAKKGMLAKRYDVFFLELAEARKALRGEDRNFLELVKRRKGELKWVEVHPAPKSYGKPPGQPPSLDAFPQEVQFVMKTMMWGIEQVFPSKRDDEKKPEGNDLKGVAASPGKYTGKVCIIMNEDQFGKLQAGDVLVCPVTTPVWSVLFPSIGALVTDRGGLLSHPAIIAREYRIPAVVATGNATSLLQDGETVTIDGDAGIIRINR